MDDFRNIKISINSERKLETVNPTSFPIISKGMHGILFDLQDGRCVKIYAKEEYARTEGGAYIKAKGSIILPELYEVGNNYIVMEYVEGSDLSEHIRKNRHISDTLAQSLILMFMEMKRMGFLRMDESLRHIIVRPDESIKTVDHFYAYTLRDEKPVKFFKQLYALGVLGDFLGKVKAFRNDLYEEWRALLPEYFGIV